MAPAAAGEEPAEEVFEARAAGSTAAPAGRKACATTHGADSVVLLALIGVRQHGISLGDVLELLLRRCVARIGIRVVLPGQLPVGLLNIGVGSVLGDTKDFV